ncbi:serine/threonine-protein phosphatase 6 regulatory subunit 3-B [Daktulosphaira vitifoliae]|uniref:serine/threonine-protein phosphatase 6 regulatory subunit 3-B n=1 Tax=Daktulosphaira vitifoliae TaxID=58002 RepID=UPI0021AA59F4|nr:serine/threonine-protein phosphatase 6 regulatory subunit 3-B [Daktulosphaira vitifoliae]XP_050539706.1 serine/threonine-protein phosphatase 6 regulatory subunit 3-B [Daktulosphaira vitifoliae]XP_050539708.1 serine/threonine-protein phosphatase 6 regulatory subunit 3-B [Daktulosphaira vitifoliae]
MYWKNNPASNWDSIFDREDLCLNDLMREQNLLEELKGQNRKLIDFLTKPDVALELVRLVTQEPEKSVQPETRFVLPNLACEILTSDVQPMYNVLSHEEEIWKCFFNFLEDNEPSLNPLMASYFSRTLCSLILKTGSQDWYTYQFNCLKTLEKMSDKGNFIDLLLKHLDTSAIMDLIIKISTLLEGPPLRSNIFSLFEKEQLICKLVDTFDPLSSPIRQLNAAEIICSIEISSDMHPLEQNPLVTTIESPEIINKLLVKMFGHSEKTESTLLGGISILQTLLMSTKFKGDDSKEVYTKKQTMAEILCITILPFLEHIHNVLLFPPKIDSLECMENEVEKLFGNVRLQIVKLICSLLSMHHQQINERFAQLNTIKVLLDCFFSYDLNNFLHTQVVQCFHEIMCCNHSLAENSSFIAHVIKDCKLIESILDHEKCIQPGKKRKGYIGHLAAIAKSLHNTETFYSDHFRGIIVNTLDTDIVEKWDLFTTTTLQENEDRMSSCLGGLHPRDEIAIMNVRKEIDEDEAIYGRPGIEFNSNDNQLGISRIDINFDDDDDEGDENDKNTMEIQAEMFNRMCSVRSSEMTIDDIGFKDAILSSTFDADDNEMWKDDEDDSAKTDFNINIFQNSFNKSDDFISKENDLYWSPETSDWETFRSQLNAKPSSELQISDNSDNNCACPSSPWGENIIEPKLETGWANFDSSFGEPIELNGESGIDQELFAHLTDDNAQDPPLNFSENNIYPINSFSIQNKHTIPEVDTNIGNKRETTYSLVSSEDLTESSEIVANSLNNSNELSKESETINSTANTKSFTKIHNVEPIDR